MSTKIYNGYILPQMTMLETQHFCVRVRDQIEEKRNQLFATLLAKLITTNFDKYQFGMKVDLPKDKSEKEFKNSFYSLYYWHIKEMSYDIERTQHRNPMYDFEFNISFLPIPNKLLCLMYTEKKEFTLIWESFEEVNEYHYQNQVDPPSIEEVSKEEWEQRRIDWDIALPGIGIPAEHGLSFNPTSDANIDTVESILEYFPSVNKRASLIAQEILWTKYLAEKTRDDAEFKYSMYFDFKDQLSKDLKDLFESKIVEIEPQIVELTRDLILEEREFNKL